MACNSAGGRQSRVVDLVVNFVEFDYQSAASQRRRRRRLDEIGRSWPKFHAARIEHGSGAGNAGGGRFSPWQPGRYPASLRSLRHVVVQEQTTDEHCGSKEALAAGFPQHQSDDQNEQLDVSDSQHVEIILTVRSHEAPDDRRAMGSLPTQ